ncbi:MAG: GNAT family N-acetyltransferase [Rhodobacteraceae bacterium]|nr:GNAT family N-acetyltransferase [Paracoccaceae bacterium]
MSGSAKTSVHPKVVKLSVRPLTTRDWTVVEQLFGSNGACGGCWCMYWRVPPGREYWRSHKGMKNRNTFRRLVNSGRASGCLAFAGNEPVGWISAGPKPDFGYLTRSRKFSSEVSPKIWSVTCFFIKAGWRGKGVATALLKGAVKLARKNKAAFVEGYPSVPREAEKMSASFAWTGVPGIFSAVGFAPIDREPRGRAIFRKAVKQEPRRRAGRGSKCTR